MFFFLKEENVFIVSRSLSRSKIRYVLNVDIFDILVYLIYTYIHVHNVITCPDANFDVLYCEASQHSTGFLAFYKFNRHFFLFKS